MNQFKNNAYRRDYRRSKIEPLLEGENQTSAMWHCKNCWYWRMALIKPSKVVTEKIARLFIRTNGKHVESSWPHLHGLEAVLWRFVVRIKIGTIFNINNVGLRTINCAVGLINALVISANNRNWSCLQIIGNNLFLMKILMDFCINRPYIVAILHIA